MNIQKVNLQFDRQHTRRRETDYHILHHADYPYWQPGFNPNLDITHIHSWHKNRKPKFYGVGYHYVILPDGRVQEGRPHWSIGAHAGAVANSKSIGTCVIGRCTPADHPTRPGRRPTSAQIKSVVELHKHLEKEYNKKLLVMGHMDFLATECPGPLFPLDEIRRMVTTPASNSEVSLQINGRTTNVPLRIVSGRTEALLSGSWVQIRDLANLLGAEIGWDASTRTVNLIVKE